MVAGCFRGVKEKVSNVVTTAVPDCSATPLEDALHLQSQQHPLLPQILHPRFVHDFSFWYYWYPFYLVAFLTLSLLNNNPYHHTTANQ